MNTIPLYALKQSERQSIVAQALSMRMTLPGSTLARIDTHPQWQSGSGVIVSGLRTNITAQEAETAYDLDTLCNLKF